MIKSRENTARFIEHQMNCSLENSNKHGRVHYGYQEARDLMDFIYGEKPTNDKQNINNNNLITQYKKR